MVGSHIPVEVNTSRSYLFYTSIASFSLSAAILIKASRFLNIYHLVSNIYYGLKITFGQKIFFTCDFGPIFCDVMLGDMEEINNHRSMWI